MLQPIFIIVSLIWLPKASWNTMKKSKHQNMTACSKTKKKQLFSNIKIFEHNMYTHKFTVIIINKFYLFIKAVTKRDT